MGNALLVTVVMTVVLWAIVVSGAKKSPSGHGAGIGHGLGVVFMALLAVAGTIASLILGTMTAMVNGYDIAMYVVGAITALVLALIGLIIFRFTPWGMHPDDRKRYEERKAEKRAAADAADKR